MAFVNEMIDAFRKALASDVVKALLPFLVAALLGTFKSIRAWVFGTPEKAVPPWRAGMVAGALAALAVSGLIWNVSERPGPAPKPATVTIVTSDRRVGGVYQNRSGRLMIVTVSANRDGVGNSMFASIAVSTTALSAGVLGGVNASTVAATSFNGQNFASSFTFVVPSDYFYVVTTDGGNVRITHWTEAEI